MLTLDNLTYAGSFAVDSGQAMVGDPCYLDNWEPWADGTPFDHEKHAGEYGYLGACGVTLKDNFGQLGAADAVVFSTGYGDGLYPVYVQMNSDGRVSKVVIDFEGDLDEQLDTDDNI
jgi:hypothetical protein